MNLIGCSFDSELTLSNQDLVWGRKPCFPSLKRCTTPKEVQYYKCAQSVSSRLSRQSNILLSARVSEQNPVLLRDACMSVAALSGWHTDVFFFSSGILESVDAPWENSYSCTRKLGCTEEFQSPVTMKAFVRTLKFGHLARNKMQTNYVEWPDYLKRWSRVNPAPTSLK